MKQLLAGLVLMFVVACAPTVDSVPADAVRVVSVGDNKFCSAVVIGPGVALTAGHCLQRDLQVDGLKVDVVVASPDGKDIALLRVPGLDCPCAPLGVRPAKGDQVLAVGFPVDREGERVVSPLAGVQDVGVLGVIVPSFPAPGSHMQEHYIVTDAAIIDHGDSGGGLFARQNGRWRVIGINAIGIPAAGACTPFVGCGPEVGSGFVPVDVAEKFL